MVRCNSANMLRQAAAVIDRKRDSGAYEWALMELADHIQQVREGTATLDEFADFYMIRPDAKALATTAAEGVA